MKTDGATWEDGDEWVPPHQRPVAYVFQDARLFPHLTVAGNLDFAEVLALQTRLHDAGFDVVKTENLYNFDGEPGYAAVHG